MKSCFLCINALYTTIQQTNAHLDQVPFDELTWYRFHELTEFDDAKRSCRRRLAGHNERRRKNSTEFKGNRRELVAYGEIDDRGRFQDGGRRECDI